MNRIILLVIAAAFTFPLADAQEKVAIDTLLSAPFPENLTAAKSGNRIAWTFDEQGKRNLWVADAPSFNARRLTSYTEDDGGAISDVRFSQDANTILYVRGEGKNTSGQFPNPTSNPAGVTQEIWSIAWSGGAPRKIDAGDAPEVSSRGIVAYLRDGQIYLAALDSSEKPKQLIVRGQNHSQKWAPDGSQLLFISTRGDHSFVGVYDAASARIRFIAPSIDTDSDAEWSPDGNRFAFIRRAGEPRDAPSGYFIQPDRPHPWAIWIADVTTGTGRELWHSSSAPEASYPYMANDTGGGILHWTSADRLLVASEQDGWQHLYSLPTQGGDLKLLTPGNCEVEQWSLTSDKQSVLFNSNCGDVDRRHLWSVGTAGGKQEQLTTGQGIEWSPIPLSDGRTFAYLGSDATHPARVFRADLTGDRKKAEVVASDTFPTNFPSGALVTPQQVIFQAADGVEIHGQLFLPAGGAASKHPALVFMHGGPIRQMLLGWHYMYYDSNSYAMNQYLAGKGYVVLSVNYRSGIGYGRAFREAPARAGRGASEYKDIVAAGKYLQSRADVDPARIGLWGGSYGGYLTALGLGRNSDIFAAGVDFHGVHDWPTDNWDGKNIPADLTKLAHESSPVSSVDTWKSPVLFVHGDDDRNVYFTQTVDLVARLRARGISIEQLVFPDDVHDFLLHRNWLTAYRATADFFDRRLTGTRAGNSSANTK